MIELFYAGRQYTPFIGFTTLGIGDDDFIVGVVQWIWYSKDEEQNSIRWNRIGRVD